MRMPAIRSRFRMKHFIASRISSGNGPKYQSCDGRKALLEMGRTIQCPVIAIHGDYDPHKAEGVHEPLSTVLNTFRFVC